jgi:PAS domain S-box-containing protein
MRREIHESGDDLREAIESPAVDPVWGEGTMPEPPPRLAAGTREMERSPLEVLDDERLELSSIPQAVFVIAPDGRIEDVNPRVELILGYTRREMIGEHAAKLGCDFMVRSRHVRSLATSIRHRGGHEVLVDVLVCPYRSASLVVFVTPRLPRERVRNSEMVQIVHDLKNPLATISLEMCLLEDKLVQPDLRGRVARVTQNVAFLDRMVQDLLDASAIDADRFEIHRRPTELRTLLECAVERSTSSRDRGRVFVDALDSITLPIDDLRIERVICNLLQNALKYSAAGAGVVIRLDRRDDFARVAVTDAGPGIAEVEQPHIFDKYTRTPEAGAHEGHGLGLYIAKRIIEAHAGRIGVHSIRGIGSSFFFELPIE